jgi:hypothetical protein
MDTSVASVVFQVSVAVSPALMLSGEAVIEAVGAGACAVGGGGAGGAGFFLWHPATVSSAAKLAASTMDLRFE